MRVAVLVSLLMLAILPVTAANRQKDDNGVRAATVGRPFTRLPNGGRPRARTPMPAIANWKTLKVSLERTICYGACPYYAVEIGGDGAVRYQGKDYVAVTGTHRAQISPDAVRALYQAFVKANFFWTLDAYDSPVSDQPTFTVTISYDGHSKKVRDYSGRSVGMPEQIAALEDAIDATAQTEKWVKENGGNFASLIAEHWDFHDTDDEHLRLIETAAKRGDTDFVKKLLAAGLSARSEHGCMGMAYAASANNPEIVNALVVAGAPLHWDTVQEPYPHDCDVVAWAVESRADTLPLVRRLLLLKPDLNRRNSDGETVLMNAGKFSSPAMVQLLLDHGADPWIADKEGSNALAYLSANGGAESATARLIGRWMATHRKRGEDLPH